MIDELIDAVARSGGLSTEQAALAVSGMVRFMAARLPSPLFGELQMRLQPLVHADVVVARLRGHDQP